MRTFNSTLVVVAAIVAGGNAFAAHPMLTEDPGTLGKGRFELELGQAFARGDPLSGGTGTEFGPQLSYGVAATVDLIARTTWLTQAPADAPAARGWGDSLLDFKWRFLDAGPFALALRAEVDIPTGSAAKGLGTGGAGFHAIAIAGWKGENVNVNANAAYARVRETGARGDIGAFSVAIVGPNATPWRTFVEATTVTDPDPQVGQWPAFARTGLIWTVAEWLDLDAGFQARLNHSATRQVWLVGATLHW